MCKAQCNAGTVQTPMPGFVSESLSEQSPYVIATPWETIQEVCLYYYCGCIAQNLHRNCIASPAVHDCQEYTHALYHLENQHLNLAYIRSKQLWECCSSLCIKCITCCSCRENILELMLLDGGPLNQVFSCAPSTGSWVVSDLRHIAPVLVYRPIPMSHITGSILQYQKAMLVMLENLQLSCCCSAIRHSYRLCKHEIGPRNRTICASQTVNGVMVPKQ